MNNSLENLITIDSESWLTPLLSILFLATGILIILARIIKVISSNCKYTDTVTAKCVELDRQTVKSNQYVNGIEKDRTTYLPVFQYNYCGLEYTALPNELHNNVAVPKPGREYTVKVNPQNPEDIYFPSAKLTAFNIVCGAVLAVVGLILMAF